MEFNEQQQEVIEHILSGKSCVLLGKAGTGKSAILKHVLPKLKNVAVCASTGGAAMSLGVEATTAHSLFGLKPQMYTPHDYQLKVKDSVAKVLRNIKTLVLEECGMTRRDVFEKMDYSLRQAKGNNIPWGGVQLLLVGDFAQLPPVVNYLEEKHFKMHYKSAWCFTSDSFKGYKIFELKKVFRQEDERQQRVLLSIRNKDKWCSRAVDVINNEAMPYNPDEKIVTLCAYNKDAAEINEREFHKNPNPAKNYIGVTTGQSKYHKQFPVEDIVKLKQDMKVRICANDENGSYANGMTGTVLQLEDDCVIVATDRGNVIVTPFEWEVIEYKARGSGLSKKVVATRKQIPLKQADAVSIHSSQGLTLERYNINLGRKAFAPNLGYVAFSRGADLRKISLLRPLRLDDIIVDLEVINFYKNLEDNDDK